MEEKIQDPAQRIEMLAKAVGVSKNNLYTLLGYDNNGAISSIIYGKTKSITPTFAKNVIKHLPQVNYLFMIDGELPVLTHDSLQQVQQNMISEGSDLTMQQIAAKLDVISKTQISILKKLEELEKKIQK